MYAKLHRTAIRIALGFAALGGVSVAHAVYTNLEPPPGWTKGTGAGALYQPPSAAAWNQSKALADAAIRSASGTSKIRVALNINSALASKHMAGRVGAALLGGPGSLLVAGLTVGAALAMPEIAAWWKDTPYEWTGNGWVKKVKFVNAKWGVTANSWTESSAQAACQRAYGSVWGAMYTKASADGPQYMDCASPGSGGAAVGSVQRFEVDEGVQVTPVEYEGEVKPAIENLPLPKRLPNIVFPQSWPVDDPIINPDSQNQPQPIFIPTGNPLRNPQFDPDAPVSPTNQPYIQPGIRVIPAPTTNEPWRVDVQPVDRPVPTDKPMIGPEIEGDPGKSDNDKPKEDTRDLCEKNPDVLACAKPELDTPDDEIPKTTKDVSYSPDNLFGGGSCPANKTMNIAGQQMTVWDWDSSCGYIQNYMRPVILVLCAFAAFVIVSGGTRQ